MDKYPVPPERRSRFEAAIRVVDMIVYAVAFAGGLALLAGPFNTVPDALDEYPGLIIFWAAFLIGGGLVGFIGRLSRYWMVENPATVAAAFGALIYAIILIPHAFENVIVALTLAFAIATLGFMVRRWFELQIFGSEPNAKWRRRLELALRRRTANAVARSS
ncbi:membrane protein [Microbacterium phage FlameThrower]|nr:membrane protein [Microbacterium phage FlameThrower]